VKTGWCNSNVEGYPKESYCSKGAILPVIMRLSIYFKNKITSKLNYDD
jgi:hypothetical protein